MNGDVPHKLWCDQCGDEIEICDRADCPERGDHYAGYDCETCREEEDPPPC